MRYDNILDSTGHTPLVEIVGMSPKKEVRIFAKLEGYNPTGSIKDRAAKYMIQKAEESGELTPDKTILEATSGNTGIALAMIGRKKGYKVEIVIPDNVSIERKQVLKLYGAEIVLSEGNKGTNGAIEFARELAQHGNYYMPDQFANPTNYIAQYETTGVEILEDLRGLRIDTFIAGIGTGGTLMGVGKKLKESNPEVRLVGVEPDLHDPIEGLRCVLAGFIPPILDLDFIDERFVVSNENAANAARELVITEGIFAGISSGATVHCASQLAHEMKEGIIVVILADGGWKYLSTGIWQVSS
jgi:cysteine synthase B